MRVDLFWELNGTSSTVSSVLADSLYFAQEGAVNNKIIKQSLRDFSWHLKLFGDRHSTTQYCGVKYVA